jgi:hypothetical protein
LSREIHRNYGSNYLIQLSRSRAGKKTPASTEALDQFMAKTLLQNCKRNKSSLNEVIGAIISMYFSTQNIATT